MHGFFVTGTDTDVGKTRVSAGLLFALSAQGLKVGGIKLVAAGMREISAGRWINDDVQALQAASSVTLSDAEVGPFQYRTPCAPHIAAGIEGRTLERTALSAHVRRLAPRAQAWVVEGVGGFCVPMSAPGQRPSWGMADVAIDLQLPVILVVGLRLGCLNHALLTAEAVRARGLTLAGWIANGVDPTLAHTAANVDTLNDTLNAPCLGNVPYLADPQPTQVSVALDSSALELAAQPFHRLYATMRAT